MSHCSIYQLLWLFFMGSVFGDVLETIFCRVTDGVWMSRSSVVWGPFSIVWGASIVLVTVLLYRGSCIDNTKYLKNHSRQGSLKPCWDKCRDWIYLVVIGTFLGAAFEYACSVFTERVFGKVFWDYSHVMFNINGRVNLLFSIFWGIGCALWIKKGCPYALTLIDRIPKMFGRPVIWLLTAFMSVDIVVSAMAFKRFDERRDGMEAVQEWQLWMDEHFDDEKMSRLYPDAKDV